MRFFISLLLATTLVAGEPIIKFPGELDSLMQAEGVDSNDTELFYPSNPDGQLYYNVAIQNFGHAITLVREFEKSNSEAIKTAINDLVRDRKISVATFAHKLIVAGLKYIVLDYYPPQYRMVFSDSRIKLINNRYPFELQLQYGEDLAGDKSVFGNEHTKIYDNYVWKLEPVDEGKVVYFKIRHRDTNRYLKLGKWSDRDGHHQAYASTESNTYRHHWLFQPVDYNGQLSFCIINREYYHSIKFAPWLEGGDRYVYSLGGAFYEYVEEHGWQVGVLKDYSRYNSNATDAEISSQEQL